MKFSFAGLFVALLSLTAVSAQTKEQFINDMNTLNYALALENFEAYLYAQFATTFPTAESAGVSQLFYQYLTDAKSAEAAHAQVLSTTIKNSGWLPAPACTYNLNNSSVGALGNDPVKWLSLLAVVEDTGAAAYTYASQLLTSADLLQFAATVATVEARHAAFLNALANATATNLWGNRFGGNVGFNNQLDVASVVNVLVTNGFLVSCPNVTGSTFDGNKTFSVFDHTGTGAYVPKLANSFRAPAGTFPTVDVPAAKILNKAQYTQDTLVLQYALTAENAEAAFYAQTLTPSAISRDVWVNYFTTLNPYASGNASLVYDFLLLIGEHEAGHAQALTSVVNSRTASGYAVPPCTYNFTVSPLNLNASDPLSFLTAARILEDTGVQAYAGAITYLSDTSLVATAASIALVEARHASYLRTLLKDTGLLPTASVNNQVVDTTLTPVQVAAVLGATFITCPNNTATDPNNAALGNYNSGTLRYDLLNRLSTAGFNDNGAYNTLGTNVKTSTSNTNTPASSQRTGSASAVFVSVAVTLSAVLAMLL